MFCSNCGQEAGGNFCSNCGAPLNGGTAQTNYTESISEILLWEGKPAGLKDKAKDQINVNSTVYRLTNQRIIIIEGGFLSKKQEEIELNKIKDFNVKQTLIEKTMGIGNIEIISIDPTSPKLTLGNVPDPFVVKDKIRAAMLEYKRQLNIQYREQL
jgi:hypothetical protein